MFQKNFSKICFKKIFQKSNQSINELIKSYCQTDRSVSGHTTNANDSSERS
jgi:hypothetical protein